ncbi:Smr/MutS family protein [Chloroflexota bacterium]
MATLFGEEERGLYNTFFIEDTDRRRNALTKWIKSTVPIIQESVPQELEDLVEMLTKDRWTDEGWKQGEEKLRRIENDYHLVMEISLRKVNSGETYRGTIPEPVLRPKIGSARQTQGNVPGQIMTKTELDLHGMTVAEANLYIEDFLKDCYKTHENNVWIIHGKGTGVLKEAVRKLVTNHPLVNSFSVADPSHGGDGAISILLKQ